MKTGALVRILSGTYRGSVGVVQEDEQARRPVRVLVTVGDQYIERCFDRAYLCEIEVQS